MTIPDLGEDLYCPNTNANTNTNTKPGGDK